MGVHQNILDGIGNTPVVFLNRVKGDCPANIIGKLEMLNPSGSIKARTAWGMILNAEKEGFIKPGSTIVEPSSGNQGVGLAMVGAVRGYRVVIVMPDSMSKERRQLVKAFGGEVVLTPGDADVSGAVKKARELVESIPEAWMPDQFGNPANPGYHEQTTGREILEQVNCPVDAFVAGVGTGGTLTGVSRLLKKKYPRMQVYAVEPAGSAVISGGSPGSHGIQGIGDGFIPGNLDRSLVDSTFTVTDEQAMEMARRLAGEEGLLAGISSGAAVYAAVEVGKRLGQGKTVLTILPDTGERYLSLNLYDHR